MVRLKEVPTRPCQPRLLKVKHSATVTLPRRRSECSHHLTGGRENLSFHLAALLAHDYFLASGIRVYLLFWLTHT